jgi:predicted aspartyl protease
MANHSNAWTVILVLSLLTLTDPSTLFAIQPEATAGQADEVPFELREGHLAIKGSLPGLDRKVNVVIDTGATTTYVQRKLAKRAGMRRLPDMGIKSFAFGAEMKVERVILRDLQLGHRLITRSCLAADLPLKEVDIVIGLDILRGTSLTIDYERSKVVFGGAGINKTPVALESEEALLVVPVTINGQIVRLAVDSGAHLTAIYRKSVASWAQQRFLGEKSVRVAHSGGFVPARQITVPSLQIGGTEIGRPTLVILETENARSKIDGFLAPASLGLNRVHFDFQQGTLSID